MLVFPWFYQDRIRVAPDGSLWAVRASQRLVEDALQIKYGVLFVRSTDSGHTWNMWSEI